MFEHLGNTIYWNAFTWEAFAALVTGGVAVYAAYRIGQRQSKIIERQVLLQHLTLRHELFDRRFAVYQAALDWLRFIAQTATMPNRPPGEGRNRPQDEWARQAALERTFLEALDLSRFIFRAEVFRALNKIWEQGNQLYYHQRSKRDDGDNSQIHIDNENKTLTTLTDTFSNLRDVFGDELQLGDGGPTDFTPIRDKSSAERPA